jgi:hypothetical protein
MCTLRHASLLLGNDRKISNYKTAVDKYWLCKQERLLGNYSVAITRTQLHCNLQTMLYTQQKKSVFYAVRSEML